MKQKIRTALAVSTILLPLSWVSPPVEAKLYHDPITNGNVLGNLAYLKEILTNSLQALQEIENLHNQLEDVMKSHDPHSFKHLQDYHNKLDEFVKAQSELFDTLGVPANSQTTRASVSQGLNNVYMPDHYVAGLSEFQKHTYYQQTLRHDLELSESFLGNQKHIAEKILTISKHLERADQSEDLAQKLDLNNRLLAELVNLQMYNARLNASRTRSKAASEYLGADVGISTSELRRRVWARAKERAKKDLGIDKAELTPEWQWARENTRRMYQKTQRLIECKRRHGGGDPLRGMCPQEEMERIQGIYNGR